MNHRAALPSILVALAGACAGLLTGCQSASPMPVSPSLPPPVISVTISPGSVSVQVGLSVQFTAQVQNDPSNRGVTWSVCGNCTFNSICGPGCGTINSTGKYTAPPALADSSDNEEAVEVVASSVADPSKQASVTVAITPAPTGISVSPTQATVQLNKSQQFLAGGVPEGTVPAVIWAVSGTGCGGPSCGVIDSSGNYTAPPVAPNPPTITVSATSVADSSVMSSAVVTLGANANNSKLAGPYAFLIFATALGDIDTGDVNLIAGSFTADGNGNITGGVFDGTFTVFFSTLGCGCSDAPIVGGTYSIGPDNRGAVTLILEVPGSSYSLSFAVALDAFNSGIAGRGMVGAGISSGIGEVQNVGGTIARQDATAFTNDAIAGDYAFMLKSPADQGFPYFGPNIFHTEKAVGRFTAGNGSLSAGQADILTFNQNQALPATPSTASFVGSYNVDSQGRGTATMQFNGAGAPFSNFAFFVISSNELLFLETDGFPNSLLGTGTLLTGLALRQTGGPFTTDSLQGAAVIYSGSAVTDDADFVFPPDTEETLGVHLAAFDGSGNLNGTSDFLDQNGVLTPTPFLGTYSVDGVGLGRGTLNLSGPQFPAGFSTAFYLVAPGQGFVLGLGTLEPQTGGPFDNSSISGNYALERYDSSVSASGVVAADGVGDLSGTADGVDGNGAGMGATFTGIYSVSANGRGTITTTPASGSPTDWILYIISPSKILLRTPVPFGTRATLAK